MSRKRKNRVSSDDDSDDEFTLDDDVAMVVDAEDEDDDDDFNLGDVVKEDVLSGDDIDDASEEDEEDDDFKPQKKKAKTATKKTETAAKKATTAAKKKATPKKKETSAKKTKTSSKGGTTTKKSGSGGGSKGTVVGGKRAAPAKPVVIKSEAEARKVIFEYMEQQNRPYNVQNVMDNLQGRVKKAMTTKVLDKLVEDNLITCKENGKAKVYLLNQEEQDVLDEDQLKELDTSITELTKQRNDLREEVKNLQSERDRFARALTHEEVKQRIVELREQIELKNGKLTKLSANTESLVSPEEKNKAMANMERFRKMWRLRKRTTRDILDLLSEGLNKKVSALKEELGIEEDPVDINSMGAL